MVYIGDAWPNLVKLEVLTISLAVKVSNKFFFWNLGYKTGSKFSYEDEGGSKSHSNNISTISNENQYNYCIN